MSHSPAKQSFVSRLIELSRRAEACSLCTSPLAAQVEELLANPKLYQYNSRYLSGKQVSHDAQLYSLVVIKRALLEWMAQEHSRGGEGTELLQVRTGIAPLIQLLKAHRMQPRAADDLRTCLEKALQGRDYEVAYLNLITGGLPWILGVVGTDTHEMRARARLASCKSWLNSKVGFRFLRALGNLLVFMRRQACL